MYEELELSVLDLRYETYRLKSSKVEKVLLGSISECGIVDSLQGVKDGNVHILLDGFKRYRCARKLGIEIVPYLSLGTDAALGILKFLRHSHTKNISILEEARLIEELKSVHKMENREVAQQLGRSASWVSMRSGILHEISDYVMSEIFSGRFPVYSYMYTLRRFIRMNRLTKKAVEEFVTSVTGKHLSIREIDMLAQGYFNGSDDFRSQIREGNISWGLDRLKSSDTRDAECMEFERSMLKALEITQRYMEKVMYKSEDTRFQSPSFFSQADILLEGICGKTACFTKSMERFYDRCKKAGSDL